VWPEATLPLGVRFRGEVDGLAKDRRLDPSYEYLQPQPVAPLVACHRQGADDLNSQIWALLKLESWLRQECR